MIRALVTGGSSGIGAATARVLARDGAAVLAVGRDDARLNNEVERIGGVASGHRAFCGDLTRPEERERLVEMAGDLDIVVHAAGKHAYTPPSRAGKSVELIRINLEVPIALTGELLRRGAIREEGAIIFVSSAAALYGSKMNSVYAASKAGLIGFARGLAADLAPRRIRVLCVVPGVVETPMSREMIDALGASGEARLRGEHPFGFGKPDDVGELIGFLSSNRARWITGTEIVIDGGYSLR